MIDDASIQAVSSARLQGDFVKPLYDTYCFSQLPQLVLSAFGGDRTEVDRLLLGPLAGTYDTVILVLVDGFGWRFFEEHCDRFPFLRRFLHEGVVTKLTSQFPSTTAAHITCIHTGLTPAESGIYEWFLYEPALDAVIQPLMFSFIGERERNTLLRTGFTPEQIFPHTTIYQRLRDRGVSSYIFQSAEFTPSPFGDVVDAGAEERPFPTLAAGLHDLTEMLGTAVSPSYFYLYYGGIDAAGHRKGIDSQEFRAQVDECFTSLERYLPPAIARRPGRTLLLMTADHGMVATDPNEVLPLNRLVPGLDERLRISPGGKPMLPSGNGRDMVLYIQDEGIIDTRRQISERLAGIAEVWSIQDMVEEGYFGPTRPTPAFLSRIGNLMVLPHNGTQVWWDAPRHSLPPFRGQHGGLTAAEMETEVLSYGL